MFDQTADNQYLHILMPYKDVNILNAGGAVSRDDDLMIEIGCKVFEVNKMYSAPPVSLNSSEIVPA